MTLPLSTQQLLTDFSTTNSWEQKMRLLMQIGNSLEPLAIEEKIEANQVQGCESRVWLVASQQAKQWHFKAYSEAKLMRGLLAILITRINHLTSAEITQLELADWFNELGLSKQLSSSRRDGLNAIWQRIKTICQV